MAGCLFVLFLCCCCFLSAFSAAWFEVLEVSPEEQWCGVTINLWKLCCSQRNRTSCSDFLCPPKYNPLFFHFCWLMMSSPKLIFKLNMSALTKTVRQRLLCLTFWQLSNIFPLDNKGMKHDSLPIKNETLTDVLCGKHIKGNTGRWKAAPETFISPEPLWNFDMFVSTLIWTSSGSVKTLSVRAFCLNSETEINHPKAQEASDRTDKFVQIWNFKAEVGLLL